MADQPDRGPERAAVPPGCEGLERELLGLLRRVDPVPEVMLAAARAAGPP